MSNEANIINVRKKDKEFIGIIAKLTPDKVALIKGIAIGLQLQEKTEQNNFKCNTGG